MAKHMVFYSFATTDSRGSNIATAMQAAWAGATTEATAAKTYPVRIHNPFGDIDVVSWEFYLDDLLEAGNTVAIKWWMEFYPDHMSKPSLSPRLVGDPGEEDAYNPAERIWPGQADPTAEWAREVLALSGGTTAVNHYRVIRSLTFESPAGGTRACRWVPLSVHAPWVRLGVFLDTATCSQGYDTPDVIPLKIYATVGGIAEQKYIWEHGDVPYAYGDANEIGG